MNTTQEIVQGVIAVALIAGYVVLAAMGKPTDHFDLGIFAVMGVYFSGKVTQTAVGSVRDAMAQQHRGPRSTDPNTPTDAGPAVATTAAASSSG